MKYELMNNNRVFLSGIVVSEPVFSHETFGEGFYEVKLSVARLSEHQDILPITVSDKLLKHFQIGKQVSLKSQLLLNVFAREIIENDPSMNPNIVEINGFICKNPIYRTTPFNREICDCLVAVNRAYNKSDYLPCIAWGRNARYVKDAKVGNRIEIVGRIQSREYQKRLESGEIVNKTAYEISVGRVNLDFQQKDEISSERII